MARAFTILSKNEQIAFDSPPAFTARDRKRYFYITTAVERHLRQVNTPKNKVLFITTLGYFKATNKFLKTINEKDICYVASQLGINPSTLLNAKYDRATRQRHRQIILEYFGCRPFNAVAKRMVRKDIAIAARSQVRPAMMFEQIVVFLDKNSIEIPAYPAIAKLVSEGFNAHKESLVKQVQRSLSKKDGRLLQALLTTDTTASTSQVARYRLTLFKRFSHSTKPRKIQENIQDLLQLKELYRIAEPILAKLDLNHEGISQYATFVSKSQIQQLSRRAQGDRYLYIIAFIAHQYFRLQDLLVDILLAVVISMLNTAEKEYREAYYRNRKLRAQHSEQLVDDTDTLVTMRNKIRNIYLNENFSAQDKLDKIWRAIGMTKAEVADIVDNIIHVREDNEATLRDDGLLDLMEQNSVKVQNRVSDIVKHLTFSTAFSNHEVLNAIESYQRKNGNIRNNAPVVFLDEKQRQHIRNDNNKIRVSLYKVLLFSHIAHAIKAGAINLENSYRYRSLDDYLISKQRWNKNKDAILKQLGMLEYKNYSRFSKTLNSDLESEFYNINQHVMNDENGYVKPDGIGGYRLSYARHEIDKEEVSTPDLFPKDKCISLSQVLSTVDKATKFTQAFVHSLPKHIKPKPPKRVFYAGIIGEGCQFGIQRIVKISNNINDSTLETTMNGYFSLENLQRASDMVIDATLKLDLPSTYQDNPGVVHTSSDGQKYNVSVDSMNASRSFKYHGNAKGSSEYTHIDARGLFTHSDMITTAEREAHYVIDGLMHNDAIKSDIHSTDTHGYSEMIFAVTHLLDFTFAPRIKNVQKQYLYAFKSRGWYKKKGYLILPNGRINEKLIEDNWDDILRFIATIKMKEATASQLFKRLNSYSKDNPLYLALKEFGKIIKTKYILNFIDDPELRVTVSKQLNKGESGNRLSRALSVGNPEYSQAEKGDQKRAEACKRLLKNAIICWNYL